MNLLEQLTTEDFLVSHYEGDKERVIVAFASAGASAPGGTVEEFKGTLARFGVSAIFVVDRHGDWYNHESTKGVFAEVSRMAKAYRHVGSMGESMGACGAILFSNFCERVSRVLAFCPQFSIMHPFVGFDVRYSQKGADLPRHFFIDFAQTPRKHAVQIVFGNAEWRDFMHRAMYAAHDFSISTVDCAPHDVAQYLKYSPHGNKLTELVGYFCDFAEPFSKIGVAARLGNLSTENPLRERFGFRAENEWEQRLAQISSGAFPVQRLEAPAEPLLSLGKPAEQSSVSAWSRHSTVEADAAGAVSGKISGGYSFHTALEKSPWWSVDLEAAAAIAEVRLYNFLSSPGTAQRAARFEIQIALERDIFTTVHRKNDDAPFGGADGSPYVWRPGEAIRGRYVRVRLMNENFLHLDQVEIYGTLGST